MTWPPQDTLARAAAAPKRVMVLYWYGKDFPGHVRWEQSFQAALQTSPGGTIEYYPEYLEENRFPGEHQSETLRNYLQQKYEGRTVDVIVAQSEACLKFLLKYRDSLFPQTPIVFYTATRPTAETLNGQPNVTGVVVFSSYRKTVGLALSLHPRTEQVFVISGTLEHDKKFEVAARDELREYERRVQINYLTDLPPNELIAKTKSLPERSVALYVWQQSLSEQGKLLESADVFDAIAKTTSAPIYGMSGPMIGRGVVGGYVYTVEAGAAKVAELVRRIANGERAADIPIEDVPTTPLFDWRELRRWGISEDSLPTGSQVRFREPTVWERYKWHFIGIISLVILEALLIVYLLVNRARRMRAEKERERFARLAEAEHKHLDEIVSNVPGIVWESLFDPDTNTYQMTFISDYAEKMLGYTTDEWLSAESDLGRRFMLGAEDRERVARHSEAVIRTGKEGMTHFRWRAKDGRILRAESSLSPIIDEAGKIIGLRGVTVDVTEKQLAEEARRESEERNRAILRAIPDLMFLQTRDGTYVDFHAKNLTELYVPPEAFLGKNMRDVMPPELVESFLRCFRRAEETGGPQVIEYRLELEEAGEQWFEARVVRSNGHILSVVRNVTERKQNEVALREAMAVSERNRAQLETVFQTVDEGIIVSDMAGDLLLVNEAEARINGFGSADEMMRNLSYFAEVCEVCYPDGRLIPTEEWPLSKVLRGETVTEWELRVRRKDQEREGYFSFSGEPVFDERGKQVLAVLVTRDITERKKAEEELRQSEARFRNMSDSAPVIIWIAGTDKLCTYLNQQWLDFTGRRLEEELGTGWADNMHPDDLARYLETYNSAFDRRESFRIECRLRRADGLFRWFLITGTPRFSTEGEFLGHIGSCVDITGQKQAEDTLQDMLEEVNRLKNQLQEENIYFQEEIKLEHNFSEIVGRSDAIKYVLHKIEQVAPTDSTVLILGETGTGKELVARAIHSASLRRDRPLIKLNCAALPASLIESELFGHEKGAFTGASARKIGRFELAHGATLFLDEIGELPPEMQVKLLRVLQESEFERLGGTRTIKVDVRIIAATNRNLWDEVQKSQFREDLWYRLNVFPITMPPLRQRREDIPLLVEHFVGRFSKKLGKKITSVAPATLNSLSNYLWPGNVRELANVMERAVINNSGQVLHPGQSLDSLQTETLSASKQTLEEMERKYIIAILDETSWRIEGPHGAATILGLNPSTLRTRMAKLNIQKPHHSVV
jgi:PAS domain S-box-containing protein